MELTVLVCQNNATFLCKSTKFLRTAGLFGHEKNAGLPKPANFLPKIGKTPPTWCAGGVWKVWVYVRLILGFLSCEQIDQESAAEDLYQYAG